MTNSIVRLLVSSLVRLCLWISLADALAQNDVPSCRRRFVVKSIKTFSVAAGGFTLPLKNAKAETFNNALTEFRAFRVLPDASKSLNPTLKTVDDPKQWIRRVALQKGGGALWLGEHHNSVADHQLQASILRLIVDTRDKESTTRRPVALGLEQVQVQFQPVLDDFVAGKMTLQEMKKQTEWDRRWTWPFEAYQPVFEAAQELNVPLVALNVNSEDLALVEKNGLPGLPRDRLREYISDAPGFASFASSRAFSTYVDYVIRPSYDLHKEMGLLKHTMSGETLESEMPFRNFFSSRILWDETMASRAYKWTQQNDNGLLIGLVGADHVKFGNGIPGRFGRMISNHAGGGSGTCVSVMLNPTWIDTRPPGSVGSAVEGASSPLYQDRLTLQLRYLKDDVDASDTRARNLPSTTGGVLPLADYIIIG